MTKAFYHRIHKLYVQCQFSDDEECLVDAIIYGTKVQQESHRDYGTADSCDPLAIDFRQINE